MSSTSGIVSAQQFSAVSTEPSAGAGQLARIDPLAPGVASGTQNAPGAAASVDVTSLSSASGAVSQALQGSDVRGDKVAGLQQAIAAGTYSVAASDVASKLMSALME